MANKDSNAQEAWATTRDEHITDFKKGKSGGGLRAAAVILWILGLAAQLSIAVIAGHKVEIPVVSDFSVVFIILAVIISLIASLMGARLWRQAEALKSTANSQLVSTAGSTLACILMVLFFITSKNATSRVKLAAIMAALIVIMICVLIVLI